MKASARRASPGGTPRAWAAGSMRQASAARRRRWSRSGDDWESGGSAAAWAVATAGLENGERLPPGGPGSAGAGAAGTGSLMTAGARRRARNRGLD